MPLLTAPQYVARSIATYPTLYLADTYDASKFLVLSQLFQTQGNGVRDWKEFRENCSGDANAPSEPPPHFFDGTILYKGFENTIMVSSVIFPDYDSKKVYLVGAEDKDQYPNVVLWEEQPRRDHTPPYPHFKMEHSLIHTILPKLSKVDISWIEAATWIYTECKSYFNGDCSDFYSAYPKETEQETLLALNQFLEQVANQKKDNQTLDQHHQHISNSYGHPYDGNPDTFLSGRWIVERQRILTFIDDTLDALAKAHAAHPSHARQKSSSSPKIK